MALWKPLSGNRLDLNSVEKHEGYVYFCIDDGTLFFDYLDKDGVLQRKQINAKDAETLLGVSLDEIKNDATDKALVALAEAQKYTDNAIANIDMPTEAIVDVEELPTENINEKILYRVHQNETYVYYAHKNGVWSQLIDVVTTSETLSADFTWDGTVTEDMESIAMDSEWVYYKMSDLIIPAEKLLNNTAQMEIIYYNANDDTNEVAFSGEVMFTSLSPLDFAIFAIATDSCLSIPGAMYVLEEATHEGILFKTGIYALLSNGEDVLCCSKITLTDPYTETIYNYTLPDSFWSAFEAGMTIGGKY